MKEIVIVLAAVALFVIWAAILLFSQGDGDD